MANEEKESGGSPKAAKTKNDANVERQTATDEADVRLKRVFDQCSTHAQTLKQNICDALERKQREQCERQTETDKTGGQLMVDEKIREKIVGLESNLRSFAAAKKNTDISDSRTNAFDSRRSPAGSKDENESQAVVNDKQTEKASRLEQNANVEENSDSKMTSNSVNNDKSDSSSKSDSLSTVKPSKKSSKTANSKKSEQKEKSTIDHVLKSLTSSTDSEKLQELCKKYVEVFNENKTIELHSKNHEKICLQLMKEKEQLQSEHNRVVLTKCKLESLCRELQKHNKVMKEETLSRIKEEEEKHRHLVNKFQETLGDIMALVQENQQRSDYLRDENRDLATKMKALMDHYDKWEKNIEQILQQKELETQIMKANFSKTSQLHKEESNIWLTEKETYVKCMTDLQKQIAESMTNEKHLRAELSVYESKYSDFQSVLTKSNEMFVNFKKDMERMSKQIKKLEKETIQWKTKWENCNRALIVLANEKKQRDDDCVAAFQKIQTLEKLCRALQDERLQMQTKIKQLEEKQSKFDVPVVS